MTDEVEERFDETHQTTYFFNTVTQKSGWTREEVMSSALYDSDDDAESGGDAQVAAETPSVEAGTETAPLEEHIEERKDESSGHTYYFNTNTQKSGWTREEVQEAAEPATDATDATVEVQSKDTAADMPDDDIDERYDENYKTYYYVNKKTGKSGWTREEVEEPRAAELATDSVTFSDDVKKQEESTANAVVQGRQRSQTVAKDRVVTFAKGPLGMRVVTNDEGHWSVGALSDMTGQAALKNVQEGDLILHINNEGVDSLPADITETKLNDLLKKKPRPLRIGMQQQVLKANMAIAKPPPPPAGGFAAVRLQKQATSTRQTSPSMSKPRTATAAGAEDPNANIEQKEDPASGHKYFFNPSTGQSGWTREEVMVVVEPAAAATPAASSGSAAGRKFSTVSAKALAQLDDYDRTYNSLVAKVELIESAIRPGSAAACQFKQQAAKHLSSIAQLNGTLEKFQFVKVDGIITGGLSSGKDDAKTRRKGLNQSCEELRARIVACKQPLQDLIASLPDDPSFAKKNSLVGRATITVSPMEGFLMKKGHKRTNWTKRFFQLTQQQQAGGQVAPGTRPRLDYHTSKGGALKGSILIDTNSKVIVDANYKGGKYDHHFQLTASLPGGGDTVYDLRAADADGFKKWVKALKHSCGQT